MSTTLVKVLALKIKLSFENVALTYNHNHDTPMLNTEFADIEVIGQLLVVLGHRS